MKLNLVILSGAGISAESGLGTFRDSEGLWEKYKIEDVATPEAWEKNPELVQDFYNQRRLNCINSVPNNAHLIIKKLEDHYNVQIITQNIDDLHERAGSTSILHLHGEITKSKCTICNEDIHYDIPNGTLTKLNKCPRGHQLRPHVVWFGEAVPLMDKAADICHNADILVIIGTSLNVYPAAGLKEYAINAKQKFIIDPDENLAIDQNFKHIQKKATLGLTDLYHLLTQKKP